jgi:recombination protein RecT
MARNQQIAAATRLTVDRTRQFQTELDQFTPNIVQALPAHISVDKFKRVLVTAVATNPDLLSADRRTLYTAAIKCASDGLMPDGRDAALVIYNTEIKLRNPNTQLDEKFRIDAVQFLPMLAGIKKRMRNSGEVLSVETDVVCANDEFEYERGDNAFIRHKPPPLGEDRGEIVGAYAIIRLKNGEIIRDVMSRTRIETARNQSRQKDGLMWTKFYDEGCCKTVLKHAAKDAPQSAELAGLLDRDDELIDDIADLPAPAMQQIEPEPKRDEAAVIEHDEDGVIQEDIPFPGDQPPSESRGIAVPQLPSGKPDYRAWVFGLFLPQVRQMMSSADLALLCGDNEAELATAKRHLAAGDLRELEALITQRWDEIAEMEKETA